MRIVILGPPGSGKAELSGLIAKEFNTPVITVGSVMQRAAAEQSELGRLAKEAMNMSRVSDELLLALLRIQLPRMDLTTGFVLVDLPKNAGQADVLDNVLDDLAMGIDLVVNIEVDPDELMERLVGRITCDNCGAEYNLYVNPPLVDGVCDACGARVVRRPDDYEETISNRLRVYEGQMGPLLQYYALHEKLHRVSADRGVKPVWPGVRKALKAKAASLAPVEPEPAPPPAKAPQPAKSAAPAGKEKPAKKAAAKKPVAKKTAPKKAAEKKPSAKKTAAKKAATTKAAPKKATAKKAAAKKPVAKKTAPKKKVVKKTVAKKPAAKKAAAKKAIAKKAPAKKVVAKKSAAKKAVAKKAPAKKTVVRKAAAKKSSAKKAAAKKAVPKKPATKKVATKKAAARKTAKKKAAAKKARR